MSANGVTPPAPPAPPASRELPLTLERFAVELREAFQGAHAGTDAHWLAVAKRALELAPRVTHAAAR